MPMPKAAVSSRQRMNQKGCARNIAGCGGSLGHLRRPPGTCSEARTDDVDRNPHDAARRFLMAAAAFGNARVKRVVARLQYEGSELRDRSPKGGRRVC